MLSLLIFLILSLPVLSVSRRSILKPKMYGFYRILAWECTVWVLANNYQFWLVGPFSNQHIISWILLIGSIFPVTAGIVELKRKGKQNQSLREEGLYDFEKTSKLVDTGIYKYIRHPLYLLLILLTRGVFLKNTGLIL